MSSPIVSMQEAMMSVGLSLYSDEFACELLAWFHVVGGSNEAVVLNAALHGALMACAKKLKIEGGEVPDSAMSALWKLKVEELHDVIRSDTEWPVWLKAICERYKLDLPREHRDYMKDDCKQERT